jgi:serine/threonine protein kinase
MQLTPEEWERVKELFEAASERDGAEREALLHRADSEGLREEVERLLREQDRLGTFLSTPAFIDKRAHEPVETRIGRYRLFEKIGEGGMGEVWLAEQTDPVRRRVALKVIKSGLDSSEIITRFQSERQALALMDHPAIARVLDAGSTDQGSPYFVMEFVAGVPITTYCDQHKLDVRERLALFKIVCEGVQHAHQKAIIHRDLKPSNILVAEIDGKPTPKIIDFGVAKALSQKLTEETLYTRVGAVIGTLEYMSPEQALSSGEDIDTRTDVYSLGVIFYELLSGAPPLRMQKIAFDEFLRQLRDDDTPRPSTRIRTLDPQTGTALATARRTEPKTLAEQIRGELDWIALKSLEKSRNRRYASATDFALDIERYLNDRPVSAVPPSPAYKLRKFGSRHTAALVTAAIFVVVLATATAISVRQSIFTRREAGVSKAISDFLRNDLLGQADPSNQVRGQLDPNLTVRAALDRAARGIDGKFAKQPEVEAALRDTIGQTYFGLYQYKSALLQFQRAAELYKRIAGKESPTTLKTMKDLGFAEAFTEPIEAEAILTRTLETQRRVLGPENPDTISTLAAIAWAKGGQGKHAEGLALQQQVLAIRKRVLGPEHVDTLETMHDVAGCYMYLGRHAESESLYRQTLQIQLRLFGKEDPRTLQTMDDLSNPIWAQGRTAEAESLLKEALEIEGRVLGNENGTTLDTMESLGEYYLYDGRCALAEPLERQVFEIQTRLQGPDYTGTLQAEVDLATTILIGSNRSKSRVNEALELTRRATRASPTDIGIMRTLGLAEYRSGHWNEAINVLSTAIQRDKDSEPSIYFLLAMAEWQRGGRTEALHNFSKGVEGTKGDSNIPPYYPQKLLWTEAATLLGKTPPPEINPKR